MPCNRFRIFGTSYGFGKPSASSRLSCHTGFDQKGWDLSVCWERRIEHADELDSNAHSRLFGWRPFALHRDGIHDHERVQLETNAQLLVRQAAFAIAFR